MGLFGKLESWFREGIGFVFVREGIWNRLGWFLKRKCGFGGIRMALFDRGILILSAFFFFF